MNNQGISIVKLAISIAVVAGLLFLAAPGLSWASRSAAVASTSPCNQALTNRQDPTSPEGPMLSGSPGSAMRP